MRANPAKRAETDREGHDRRLFDDIAGRYSAKDRDAACRLARRHRLRQTMAAVPGQRFGRVLELGCGAGYSAVYLRGMYSQYVGVDYAENLIRYARRHNASPHAAFHNVNIRDYTPKEAFDVVFMVGVLHHLDRPHDMVRHIASLVRPGGWFAVNEPQPANALIRAARRVRAGLDRSYSREQAQIAAPELKSMLTVCGFTDVRVRPQGFFSTPFAEVILRPRFVVYPLAAAAVAMDTFLTGTFGRILHRYSWNLVASGSRAVAQS